MVPIIFYLTYMYPNREEFYLILDKLEQLKVPFIEIGIPVTNPFKDGQVIRDTHKYVLENTDMANISEEMEFISKNYSFQTVIMTYKEALAKYDIINICKNNDIGLLCVDESNIDHKVKVIKLYNGSMNKMEIINNAKDNSLFAYLMRYDGQTGEKDPVVNYRSTLKIMKDNIDLPIYLGFGVSDLADVVKSIESGADGAIIGSELIKQINNNEVDKYLATFKDYFG